MSKNPFSSAVIKYRYICCLFLFFTEVVHAQVNFDTAHRESTTISNEWQKLTIYQYSAEHSWPKVYVLDKDTIQENAADTSGVKYVFNNSFTIRSEKVIAWIDSFEEDVNAPYPIYIPQWWITAASRYDQKKLPQKLLDSLERWMLPSDIGLEDVAKETGISHEADSFSLDRVQLDDDPDKDIILYLGRYADFPSFFTIILKQTGERWKAVGAIETTFRYEDPEPPYIDTQKLIVVVSEGWGTAFSSDDLSFYKLINGKLYHCLDLGESVYQGMTAYGELSQDMESEYKFLSDTILQATYTYSLFKENMKSPNDLKAGALFILKDQDTTLTYHWDKRPDASSYPISIRLFSAMKTRYIPISSTSCTKTRYAISHNMVPASSVRLLNI